MVVKNRREADLSSDSDSSEDGAPVGGSPSAADSGADGAPVGAVTSSGSDSSFGKVQQTDADRAPVEAVPSSGSASSSSSLVPQTNADCAEDQHPKKKSKLTGDPFKKGNCKDLRCHVLPCFAQCLCLHQLAACGGVFCVRMCDSSRGEGIRRSEHECEYERSSGNECE